MKHGTEASNMRSTLLDIAGCDDANTINIKAFDNLRLRIREDPWEGRESTNQNIEIPRLPEPTILE